MKNNNQINWHQIRVKLPNGKIVTKRVKNIDGIDEFIERQKQNPNFLDRIKEMQKEIDRIIEESKKGEV